MTNRLLDRQVDLLNYLTSSDAIFADGSHHRPESAPGGMDWSMLNLEARFSFEKRMAKIEAVFPLTFALLGSLDNATARAFVDACPPADISRIENARQFYQFLCDHRRHSANEPTYLRDVAICEFACASVSARADDDSAAHFPSGNPPTAPNAIRRKPGIILLRCGYDVRPIFETGDVSIVPQERVTPLAIIPRTGDNRAAILELRPVAFDLLTALDDWTDPTEFGLTLTRQGPLDALAQHGLIEIHA